MYFDYLILGNGAIGTLSAIQLKRRYPSLKVGIVGLSNRENGASVAAGAMCNVFAEVEETFSGAHKKLVELSLWYGMAGREGWLDLISSDLNLNAVKTAEKTLVFLKNSHSDFELKNYEKAKSVSRDYGVVREVEKDLMADFFQDAINLPLDAFLIDGEFALDTQVMFHSFDKLCTDMGIVIVDSLASIIDLETKVVVTKGAEFRFDRLVVALGSNSSNLLPKGTIQSLVQGVGTAIEIKKKGVTSFFSSQNTVIRSVNRGGAQCGFHFVPRNDAFYLGAGNYIMEPGQSEHRLETIRYLFNTFEKELCGREISYKLEGRLVKGHRPRTLDGFPLIGHLPASPQVFIATGTNRAGLTWAPKIANQVIAWSEGEEEVSPFSKYVSPDREAIQFGSDEEAIHYYCESRIGAALEHKTIESSIQGISSERLRLQKFAEKLLRDVKNALSDKRAVPHPDHWAIILEKPSICYV